jgi:hypothetical protein
VEPSNHSNRVHPKWLSKALLFSTLFFIASCEESSTSASSDNAGVTGTGGSTARMTISGDYLYAISGANIQLLDITMPATPIPWTKVWIDWNIQTLFPYGDYLLVGAADGMHILDNTDPASPEYIADFRHARAVDPVVAHNDIAYVTLKVDTSWPENGIENQMNVIDIADVTRPVLLDTIPMQGPEGLSVLGERLYVCDDIAGVKIFDVSIPTQPRVQGAIAGLDCSDVIAQGNLLFVISDNGLLQYDVSTETPVLLSTIETAESLLGL